MCQHNKSDLLHVAALAVLTHTYIQKLDCEQQENATSEQRHSSASIVAAVLHHY